jgi:Predicted EndoIII-related endonuclease
LRFFYLLKCTDERVNEVTPKLFSVADNPKDMSKFSIDRIYKIIKPCVLGPQKSKAIHKIIKYTCKKT